MEKQVEDPSIVVDAMRWDAGLEVSASLGWGFAAVRVLSVSDLCHRSCAAWLTGGLMILCFGLVGRFKWEMWVGGDFGKLGSILFDSLHSRRLLCDRIF